MFETDIDACNEYTADALKVLKLKFVSDSSEINSNEPLYNIEFAYQQFGDNEVVLGYKDISLTLCFTDATMYPHLIMKHKGLIHGNFSVDDIPKLFKEHLVYDQQDCFDNRTIFEGQLEKQATFHPLGQEIPTFMKHTDPEKSYALYRIDGELSENAKCFVERIQSVLFFYIEGVKYTDSDDSKFIYYILYETYHKHGTTGQQYRIVAYLSFYKYYRYPDKVRLRGSHTFVFPQFRKIGICSKLLHAVNVDVKHMSDVYDVTLETPAPELVLARDYTTVLEVISMPEFTKSEIKKPLTEEKKEILRKEWKMYNKQAIRTFDILQYALARKQSKEAVVEYKAKLAYRIKKPYERKEQDYRRMLEGLEVDEMDAVTSNVADNLDEGIVKKVVERAIVEYAQTIERLLLHSKEFQNWL